jgi:hypothetical protein
MTEEDQVKTMIFQGLLGALSHQEALFVIDIALREKTDSIYESLSVEEKEELILKFNSRFPTYQNDSI